VINDHKACSAGRLPTGGCNWPEADADKNLNIGR